MKRISLAIVIFMCAASIPEAEEIAPVRLAWTVQNAPWFYESLYETNNIGFATALLLGFDVGGVVIGGEFLGDYVSMNGQDPANLLQGSWIDFGLAADFIFRPAAWMDVKVGAGGLFQRSSFQYNESGWLGLNRWGALGMCDLVFMPRDFIGVTVKNRIDLLFAFDSGDSSMSLLPNYTGGLRIDVRPGIEWLSVFAEADAFFFNYTSDVRNVRSWMFQAQLGVTLVFGFGKKTGAVPADIPDIKVVPKTLEEIEPALTVLGALKSGTEAVFTTILFEKGKGDITANSIPVLDRIAGILLKNKKAGISVQTYAEYSGNPVFDLELIRIRAVKIRSYLVGKGVPGSAIKLASMGQVINPSNSKSKVPTVVIKVLSR